MKQIIKGSLRYLKKQAQIADVFDGLATTQEKGSITKEDIKLVEDESLSHPYESLLRFLALRPLTIYLNISKS